MYMKKLAIVFCAITSILAVVILSGCVEQKEGLSEIKTTLWKKNDLEYIKLGKDPHLYVYKAEMSIKPLFYKGDMPLRYKVAYGPETVIIGLMKPIYYDFGDFRNYFIYDLITAKGAQTYDREGALLAEAVAKEGDMGIELEEIHYHDGAPIFKCKCLIDPTFGEKKSQTMEVGKKERDYYFLWPVM